MITCRSVAASDRSVTVSVAGENCLEVAEEGRIELQGIEIELRPVPRATARVEGLSLIPKPGGG